MTGPLTDERLEETLRDLLAERGRTTNGDIRAVLDGLDGLPDRSAGRRPWLAGAAAIAILAIGGGLALGRLQVPLIGGPPVGRDAFRDDPRLAACEATTGTAAQVFQMTHAEWFPLYFPGWYRGAPELEVADPALVVIGPEHDIVIMGGLPRADASGPPPTPAHGDYLMCIAVGTGADATLHQYGPTWFDRIVPVLSDVDVQRAAHLDPDVLADPAAWRFPERLAPCGGITGNELYIFEARFSELDYYFPKQRAVTFRDDDPVAVVVYRDPLPGVAHGSQPPGAPVHDICIASELEGAQPDHVLLPDVDITGFHVRIDKEIDGPPIVAPGPTPVVIPPSAVTVTPEPLPAWAGDAATSLQCTHPPPPVGPSGPQDIGVQVNDPTSMLQAYLDFAQSSGIVFPLGGFTELERAPGARLYTLDVGSRTKAAIVLLAEGRDESAQWSVASVASCDPSELDPKTAIGGDVHVWHDVNGDPVPLTQVFERADCYGARTFTVLSRLFVRDPTGQAVGVDQLDATYRASIALPKDAGWLGFVDGSTAMWVAADGKALYLVKDNDEGHAERLPHVEGDAIQRIDCN